MNKKTITIPLHIIKEAGSLEKETLKERLLREQTEQLKRGQNRFLIGFLILFFAVYIFFFSSTVWMPESYTGIQTTAAGTQKYIEDRTVTLASLSYSETQKRVEAIIQIQNQALDGINRYEWEVFDRQKGRMNTKLVLERDDLVVLHISVPSRWTELSIRMNLPDSEERLRIYASKQDIEAVSSITIQTPQDYERVILRQLIAEYRKEIKKEESVIQEQQKRIKEADKQIQKLQEELIYETEEDGLTTKEQIYSMEAEKEASQNQIQDAKDIIAEYEAKIEKVKEKYQSV